MIRYTHSLDSVAQSQVHGFFVGWPNPPAPDTHWKLLQNSQHLVLAVDDDRDGRVVGFITAISDGVLSAYIPLLEVLPEYQGQGIGQALTRLMLEQLRGLYMVDILCDPSLQPFYARFGLRPTSGMMMRHYDRQSGRA